MRRSKGEEERQRDRGGGRVPAAEKYSRFLQPPLPVSAGHDCNGKPKTKPKEKNPFSGRPCSVSHSKGCFTLYTGLCVWGVWTIGRFGHDTSLFSV